MMKTLGEGENLNTIAALQFFFLKSEVREGWGYYTSLYASFFPTHKFITSSSAGAFSFLLGSSIGNH